MSRIIHIIRCARVLGMMMRCSFVMAVTTATTLTAIRYLIIAEYDRKDIVNVKITVTFEI